MKEESPSGLFAGFTTTLRVVARQSAGGLIQKILQDLWVEFCKALLMESRFLSDGVVRKRGSTH